MFGYVKVDQSELKGKEYETYRAVYCSLCKTLGKEYSVFARFILSYDCTFYALLMMSLSKESPSYQNGRCRFNPAKKCRYCQKADRPLSLAAALSISSAYFKLLDDIHDSPWYRRIFFRILQPFFSRWRKKARRRYPVIDKAVADMVIRQGEAERDQTCTVDQAAEPTAEMLKTVCSVIPEFVPTDQMLEEEKLKRVLETFGYFLGRWIYLIDAADDLEKDRKHHLFNPFILAGISGKDAEEKIMPILNHSLSEALLSYGLLEKGRFDSIISNVLYIAAPKIQHQVLSKYAETGLST